jgi:hypothetical protein
MALQDWIDSCASFDFAQDEEELDVPSPVYLILSEVEGRMTALQVGEATS